MPGSRDGLNICYMVPDVALPHYRGSSTHVMEVSRSLSDLGHKVSVISRRLTRSQPRWEMLDGFEIFRTFQGLAFEPPTSSYSPNHVDRGGMSPIQRLYFWYLESFRAFQLGVEMATFLSGRGIDVVIERETAFGAGAVLSSLLGVPMVLEMIGPRVSPMSLKRARLVLAYSEFMTGGRVPRDKIELVPSGVNTALFRPDALARERLRKIHALENEFVVGYVGTFQRWHGVNGLLSACKRLNSSSKRVKVLLVGPYFEEAKRFADELGMKGDVLFVGPIPYESVPGYVNACDVLCAPYDPSLSNLRKEGGIGAPLKVLEYMACEKPVVATRVPPITEVIEDGRTGYLVPPGDPDALCSAIEELVVNQDRAAQMGVEARRVVVARYPWEGFVRTLERALDAVKSGRGT